MLDAFGREAKIERGAEHAAKSVTAPFGQKTALTIDAKGVLTQIVDPIGRTGAFTYDAGGLLTARNDARGGDHLMTYDAVGQLVTDQGPGGKTWTLADGAASGSAETKVTSAMGRESRMAVKRTGPSSETRTTTRPDGTKTTTTQTATSVVSQAADGTKVESALAPDPQWGMSAPYAATTTVTYPSGATVKRVETRAAERTDPNDPAAIISLSNMPVKIGPVTLTRESASGFVSSVQAAGTFESVERTVAENGAPASYGEPSHIRISSNGAGVYDLKLTRDAAGRIVDRTELLDGATRVSTYGYDSAGRLFTVKQDGVATGSFSYDDNGNRTQDAIKGVSATYDARDRILTFGSRAYTHDARGDRTSMKEGSTTVTYEHDARGALRTVKNGALSITYDVDGWGRRVARRENGAVTHRWLYRNALQPVAEYDAANTLRWRFIYSPGRHVPEVAMDGSGATYKLVTDQVGSLRLVIRGSDGAIMQRLRHDAWGAVEEDFVAPGFAALPFGFAGGMADRGTGLVHFGLRDYDSEVGRWLQPDPIGLAGGLNPYTYVGNSPAGHTDHAGLWRDDDPRIDRYNASMAAASDAERAGVAAMVGLALTPWALKGLGALVIEAGMAAEVTAVVGEVTAAEVGAGAGVGAGCAKAASGARPLVYGPSADLRLRATAERLGGQLLSDLEKPTEMQWRMFSFRTLDGAAAAGRPIVFDLTHMEDIPGTLAGTGPFAETITGAELQYIQANWARFQGVVTFIVNDLPVGAPW